MPKLILLSLLRPHNDSMLFCYGSKVVPVQCKPGLNDLNTKSFLNR